MLHHRILLTFFTALLCLPLLKSQDIDPISADRPGAGDAATVTPKGYFQNEIGVVYEQITEHNKSYVLPTILWKYGIFENTEVRLITDIAFAEDFDEKYSGLTPITIGLKTKLTDEKGILPLTSFIGHLSIPELAGKHFKASYYAPSFGLLMHNSLTDKLGLDYNIGASWDGETPVATFFYALSLGYNFTEKLGSFVEGYAYSPESEEEANYNFDYGLTYLLSNNMVLDISNGFGLSDNASDYFVSFGFSYRLNTHHQ